MKIFKTSLFLLFLLLGTFACQQSKEENSEEKDTEEAENTEENTDNTDEDTAENTEEDKTENETKSTRGQIVKLGEAGEDGMLTIQVDHEEIPDVMMAMRMELKVSKDDVAELKEGDKISFEMLKTENGHQMQNIEKLPEDTELTLKKAE